MLPATYDSYGNRRWERSRGGGIITSGAVGEKMEADKKGTGSVGCEKENERDSDDVVLHHCSPTAS